MTIDIARPLHWWSIPSPAKLEFAMSRVRDIALDYYRIESTNGSLRTANFNGTTGWNSLDDQNLGAIGGWHLVNRGTRSTDANSANRLIEQFLLGDTTLAPGQSVSLGAPVNPAILNNQLGSLALRFGGASIRIGEHRPSYFRIDC